MKYKVIAVIAVCTLLGGCVRRIDSQEQTAATETVFPSPKVTTVQTTTVETAQPTTEITTTEPEPVTEPEPESEPVPEPEPEPEPIPEPEPEPAPEPEPEPEPEPDPAPAPAVEAGVTYEGGFYYIDGILLVNKSYPLPDSYAPGGLTSETLSAFYRMQAAAASEGISLFVKSGYRSYIDQKIIYRDYSARDGAAAADRYSARPGHSEHQTGMAMDLNSLDFSFADTPEGIWLAAHCAEYGFIIRYPAGCEDKTGYVYEPWHVRYVGEELARKITDSGLCLEEYYGISSAYR